ncbi:acyl-CoA synthetase (AMP-forming)/AMP-acid ligase II [Bradyrhizobium ottawaense]|uniref:Acyl-CoA synthetase (AMP-forming)/AMP-acid ligase II n=1 Tax=Bradyrhizobium ottawaense TaxID=931866 RepID=A0ABV4FYA9_9BRAD
MINLSSFIAFHARRTPDRPALKYRGEEISYAALDARVRMVAGWLAAQGISAGDIVAVLMKNSAAFLELVFATSHLGAVFLPINFRLSRDEVGYITGNAGARLLIVDEELAANAAGTGIVVLDDAAQQSMTHLAGDVPPAPMHGRAPSDLMRLMYTSGTTDRPKGVMLSYDNFYWKSADQTIALGLSAETRLLVVGPLYHVGALDLPGLAVLWHGGFIRIERNFEPETTLAAIAEDKLNAAWFAPVMTSAMLTCPTRERYDVSSLRWAIGGGEKTPELRIRAFSQLFRNARYIDAYGLTETARRRHLHGGRPRDREDRLDGACDCPRRNRDPRRGRQGRAGERQRRDLLARTEDHARLLEGSGEDGVRLLRRLVPQRRRRLSR